MGAVGAKEVSLSGGPVLDVLELTCVQAADVEKLIQTSNGSGYWGIGTPASKVRWLHLLTSTPADRTPRRQATPSATTTMLSGVQSPFHPFRNSSASALAHCVTPSFSSSPGALVLALALFSLFALFHTVEERCIGASARYTACLRACLRAANLDGRSQQILGCQLARTG